MKNKMVEQSEMINQLKAFGLNTYEAKLWIALLSKGVATAGELSDFANVPRSRSYDVLESLEKKGFIMMKIGKPIKYVAVKPSDVLDRVKKRISLEAQSQEEMVERISESEAFEEIRMLHSQGIETIEPNELTGTIKGRSQVYNHLSSQIKNAEQEIIIMTTSKGLQRKADSLGRYLEKAKRKGVEIKILAPLSEDTKKAVNKLSNIAQIKHVESVKSRFVISDAKELSFMLADDENINSKTDSAVYVNTRFFSTSLKTLFNNLWEKAKDSYEMFDEEEIVAEKIYS
jgi:sugar-specific transcriptional regulator TrmB